ncbi:MAG: DUF1573 domain-containing protein [Sphingobacteriales bacterium]|nr:DUF1573 domain-containing protein [Sphingobacteriales bacterium]
MSKIYPHPLSLLGFAALMSLLQACQFDPQPKALAIEAPTNTVATATNSEVAVAETASDLVVAAENTAPTVTETVSSAATQSSPAPEKVRDAKTLRDIADKVVTTKKERQAKNNKDTKVSTVVAQATNTQTEATETETDKQPEKPVLMNVADPAIEQQPERATAPRTSSAAASMVFDKQEQSFGVIATGEIIERNFDFTNKGSVPLIIYDASSSCGCTIPEYPKEPIMPGERGAIKVTYDSKGKIGTQDKAITLKTNAGTHTVHLKGAVFTENMMKKDKQ